MGRHSWRLVDTKQVEDSGKRLQFERGIYSADYLFQPDGKLTRMTVDYKTDYTRL